MLLRSQFGKIAGKYSFWKKIQNIFENYQGPCTPKYFSIAFYFVISDTAQPQILEAIIALLTEITRNSVFC